jgi:serine/threonine protein kinase
VRRDPVRQNLIIQRDVKPSNILVSRGGDGDRIGGGQTDRGYPQLQVGTSGVFDLMRWGRPN